MRKRRKLLIFFIVLAVLLIAGRIALPYVIEDWANEEMREMGDYSGHVDDVDLALWRGAYSLHDLTIVKLNADIEEPFLDLPTLDLSLQWKALFKGRMVGEAVLHRPVLNLVQGEGESDTQLGRGVNWPDQVRELFPFQFDRVAVVDGTTTFRAPGIDTDDSLTLHDAQVELRNLSNVEQVDREAFADLEARGAIMGNAPLRVHGSINPNARQATFDLNLELEDAALVEVNPWLREYLKVDAEQGTFSMYSEMATADGRFEGYVKPILEDPKIFSWGEETKSPLHTLWEGLVQLIAKVFENPPEDQVATQIPLSGELEDPDADLLATFVNLARNAFVAAFTHSIDNSVSISDVRGAEPAASEQD